MPDVFSYDSRNPIYDKPYAPEGGSGILEVPIWVTFGQNDIVVKRMLAYSWSETVNGIEIDIQKPDIKQASALEEDINLALKEEFKGKSYTINFITK